MSDTVCIAAVCVNPGRVFAILCSDSEIAAEGVGTGDIGFKGVPIAPGIIGMYAGSLPDCRALTERYTHHLSNPDVKLTPENSLEILSAPLRAQQQFDVANLLSARYGVPYEDYLAKDINGQRDLTYELQTWRGRAELIIVWLGNNLVRLFHIGERVTEQSSFTSIGCGAEAARASLFSRGFSSHSDIREAAYYVYEAKRMSEKVPGVGKETHMLITEFHPAGTNILYRLTPDEIGVLGRQFARFGPQKFEIPKSGDTQLDFAFIPGKKP